MNREGERVFVRRRDLGAAIRHRALATAFRTHDAGASIAYGYLHGMEIGKSASKERGDQPGASRRRVVRSNDTVSDRERNLERRNTMTIK